MNSSNITHVPINRRGCLELGLSPCSSCQSGFASSPAHENSSCFDSCEYFRIYCDKEEMDLIQLRT